MMSAILKVNDLIIQIMKSKIKYSVLLCEKYCSLYKLYPL